MKKILAIMLSVMMILCMMPGMAFADDASKTAITSIAFENPNAAYTYTGSEIRPAIVVKAGNTMQHHYIMMLHGPITLLLEPMPQQL
ncbi:hypothetical protein [Senimuribacter intestinalis]|uniref:hypothetical protein n=1 Tax=Senimuribacter intestinalis TaxID=2941507 RepID=UPI00203F944D|nr:hypothetical protein [Senimuribacter intestinalis]